MTINLVIPPETEQRLREKADIVGVDPAGFVRLLIEQATNDIEPVSMTPAETVAYWMRDPYPVFEGLPDSPELARDLRRRGDERSGRVSEQSSPRSRRTCR